MKSTNLCYGVAEFLLNRLQNFGPKHVYFHGILNISQPSTPPRPVPGIALLFFSSFFFFLHASSEKNGVSVVVRT
jgi:hypothetical protein